MRFLSSMSNMKIAFWAFHSKFSLAFNPLFQILGAVFYFIFNRRGHDFYFCLFFFFFKSQSKSSCFEKNELNRSTNLWFPARRPFFFTTYHVWDLGRNVDSCFRFSVSLFWYHETFSFYSSHAVAACKKKIIIINQNKWNSVVTVPSVLSGASVEPKGRVNNCG